MEETKIDRKEAENDVLIMAERLASLYYFMVNSIIEEAGEEAAERIVRRAIREYGLDCGKRARDKVLSLEQPVTLQNYRLGKDLPSLGWKKEKLTFSDPCVIAHRVLYCPLAAKWKETGFEKWGRMYCFVDQAKYEGYCSGMHCHHDKNLLDGDECCIVRTVDEREDRG